MSNTDDENKPNLEPCYEPIYYLTCIFATIFLLGIILPFRGENRAIWRTMLMSSAFSMWILWVTVYVAQMNPVTCPKLKNTSLAWIDNKWGTKMHLLQETKTTEADTDKTLRFNPPGTVVTTFPDFEAFAYRSRKMFNGRRPSVKGDFIQINFIEPTTIHNFIIKTGDTNRRQGIVNNAVLQAITGGTFKQLCAFDENGIAQGNANRFGRIQGMRIYFTEDSVYMPIFKEISFEYYKLDATDEN